eukprot:2234820-Prymnesium_polylepis.1
MYHQFPPQQPTQPSAALRVRLRIRFRAVQYNTRRMQVFSRAIHADDSTLAMATSSRAGLAAAVLRPGHLKLLWVLFKRLFFRSDGSAPPFTGARGTRTANLAARQASPGSRSSPPLSGIAIWP